ncbi:MAG: hypothetical protein JSS82_14205 [Bacteroidetes bacterium]|nr:hypothetical protein [Bacteroidota bacterium]
MSQLQITGQVLFATSTLPLSNVRVEIWDSSGGYGWIASTHADAGGNFTLSIPETIGDLITASSPTVVPLYRVFKNNILVNPSASTLGIGETIPSSFGDGGTIIPYTTDPVVISITDLYYDALISDKSDATTGTYITVKGRITNGQKVPVSDLTVNIYEADLGDGVLLTSATPDWDGYYEAKVNFKNLANSRSLASRALKVNAVDSGDTVIVSSGFIFNPGDSIEVNLSTEGTEYTPSISEFELLGNAITAVTGSSNPFASITSDSDDLSADPYPGIFAYLANATGRSEQDFKNLAYARKYAYSFSVTYGGTTGHPTVFFYALCKIHGIDFNPVLRLKEDRIRDSITIATNSNIIREHSSGEIDAFVAAALAYQLTSLKTGVIAGEEPVTLNDMTLAIFGNSHQTNADHFIALYNSSYYSDINDFWTDYETAYGSTLTVLAKKGVSMIPFTGFQPEMLAFLMDQTSGADNFSALAAWSEETWLGHIENLCTANSKLCIPKFIKGDITDVDNSEVKATYAKRLKAAVQEFYPLMAVKGHLDGSAGGTLISDSTLRTLVSTFIGNNPNFDLRVSSIHDITSDNEDIDLTGVDDIETLKEAIVPFQRLLSVTGGQPEAIVGMMSDGIDSARAIADTPEEIFIENYSEAFGGGSQAQQAYNNANNIAATAMNTTATVFANLMNNNNAAQAPNPAPGPLNNFPPRPVPVYTPAIDPTSDPTLRNMFGSLDYCCCCHCMSLYSPSAYLTDMLHFLKANNVNAYNELIRRRPDLIYIDLTCKNTDTALPYVDLVNELLEMNIIGATAPKSFQTDGTVSDLAGHPEHIYKDANGVYQKYTGFTTVYDSTLANAIYPSGLPFSLALEESRAYLKHLGLSRFDAMNLFMPYNQVTVAANTAAPHDQLTLFSSCVEFLGMSQTEAEIITRTHAQSNNYWLLYGLPASYMTQYNGVLDPANPSLLLTGSWDIDILGNRVDVLLHYAGITYDELLQLLSTNSLNANTIVNITAHDDASPDTCDLTKLKLKARLGGPGAVTTFLTRMAPFMRLVRVSGLSIFELDNMANAIGASFGYFNNYSLINLTRALSIGQKLDIEYDVLNGWLYSFGASPYYKYGCADKVLVPSTYDRLFRNPAVFNPTLDIFDLDAGHTFAENAALVANACGLKEEDTLLLYDFIKIYLDHPYDLPMAPGWPAGFYKLSASPVRLHRSALSRLYTYAQLSKKWKISIKQLIELFSFHGFDTIYTVGGATALPGPNFMPPTPGWDTLVDMDKSVDLIRNSPFSIDEISYLIKNIDERLVYTPDSLTIQLFYEDLRNELKKFPLFNNTQQVMTPEEQDLVQKLVNTVYQSFSKQFRIPSAWVETMISDGFTQTSANAPGGFLGDIIDDGFVVTEYDLSEATIATQVSPPAVLTNLYYQYRIFHKVALLANKLGLRTVEFNYLYQNPSIINFHFNILVGTEVNTPVLFGTQFDQFRRLLKWIQVRDTLHLVDVDFVELLHIADGSQVANTFFGPWKELIARNSTWSDFFDTLLGTTVGNSPTGILRVKSPDNFKPSNTSAPELIMSIADIVSWVRRIGLNPDKIQKALLGNVVLTDSDKIIQAAKGKHRNSEWNKIAKPIRDVLRERQRKALVSYTVNHPDIYNHKVWLKENDLYAYFLIDVEMSPCMKTSRIKQAISSVQLFVDRILLNQEYTVSPVNAITLTPDQTKQWDTWRKWYRVWEANRKVFLYPENWLEPELRDDKTPFFEEFETQLLQADITDDHVYDAMEQYLHKVDEIARLEPVGTCESQDPITGKWIVHAVSRTYGDPHKYYYRRLVDDLWTPWEYIDIDIKSEHVVPYVWNNRLHLYWLTFKDKQNKTIITSRMDASMTTGTYAQHNEWFYNRQAELNIDAPIDPNAVPDSIPRDHVELPQKQLEISMNWSEYKNGKWQKHKIGKEKMLMKLNPYLDRKLKERFEADATIRNFYSTITNQRTISTTDMVKSMFFVYPSLDVVLNHLYVRIYFNHDTIVGIGNNPDVTHIHCTHYFRFKDDSGEPEVLPYSFDNELNVITPTGTYHANMRFNERPYGGDRPLKLDHYYKFDWNNQYYSYINENFVPTLKQIGIDSSSNILNSTNSNGLFSVVVKSNFQTTPLENQFMFADFKNTYFVRLATPKPNIYYIDPNLYNLNLNDPHTNFFSATLINWKYYFQTFYHPHIHTFVKTFNAKGFDGLLTLDIQKQNDTMNFLGDYQPNLSLVHPWYPTDVVDFNIAGAYSIYNWEIFFHIPLMIAQRLSENQQFAEARKWFHYIFDPTSTTILNNVAPANATEQRQCFWKFRPFYDQAGYNIQTLNDILILINWGNAAANAQVGVWEQNPFNPWIVARLRMLAFMKSVVMKYVDNLIAWGDMLFERNTIESINEATQMYILAANILGDRPVEIPKRVNSSPKCFHDLENSLDKFSNAAVAIESYMPLNIGPVLNPGNKAPTKMFYFCLSPNDKLLAYWDTVADRLFKIRNCRNIQGQKQELPLFEPPIDPALLIRATAAGIDISSVLNDISNVNLPHYRFSFMLQKANEFTNDIKVLGGALLSALEKKDAEELALLRSGLELNVLESMKRMKQAQLDEATANRVALDKQKDVIQERIDYYGSRPYQNSREQEYVSSLKKAAVLQEVQAALQGVASVLSMIPQFHAQAIAAVGASWGGQHLGPAFQAASTIVGIKAISVSAKGNVANVMGGYDRRKDDWDFQARSARKELAQLEKQLIAADIRINIAERDLENQEIQIENNLAIDEYMRSKYTNKELYNWMITQISTTYFQAYRLAYEMAKKAGSCYDFELPFAEKKSDEIIQFGYWDSLRKGLLSGEKLQYDLRKLEAAYLDENKRELELTKHVSLAMLDPEQLLILKDTGSCTIDLPLWLFNLDYPGHYNRRLKSVSLSIPCVAGPYTTIACELSLMQHEIDDVQDQFFSGGSPVGQLIATSSAQNDNGLFDFNFRDERYLPFEAYGAVSTWTLTLMTEQKLRQFDYSTISDVILHVKYTAQSDDAKAVNVTIPDLLDLVDNNTIPMPRYFSVRHEFSNQWFNAFSEVVDNLDSPPDHVARSFTLSVRHDQFPAFCKDRTIDLGNMTLFLCPTVVPPSTNYFIDQATPAPLSPTGNMFTGSIALAPTAIVNNDDSVDITFNLYKEVSGTPTVIDEDELTDLYLLIEYTLD